MDFFLWKGLIMVLLMQRSRAQEPPGSGLPSGTVVLPHGEASRPRGAPLSPGDAVAPAVAPPGMKEVEQAVQEASEQVEGGGAEEVLKGLLERVVEAALGEAGGPATAAEQPTGVAGGAGEGGEAEAEAEAGGGGGGGGGGGTAEQASDGVEAGAAGGLGAAEEGPDGGERQEEELKGEPNSEAAGAETETAGGDGETGPESEEAATAGAEGGAEEPGEAPVATSPVGPKGAAVEPTDILEKLEKQVEEIMTKAGGEEVLEQSREGDEEETTTEGTAGGGESEEGLSPPGEQIGGETETGGAGELGGGEGIEQPGDVTAREENSHVEGSVVVRPAPGGGGGGGGGEANGTPAVLGRPMGEQEEQEVMTNQEEEPGSLEVNGGLAGTVVPVAEAADVEVGEGAGPGARLGDAAGAPPKGEEVRKHDTNVATDETGESSLAGQKEEQEVPAVSPGQPEHGAGDKTSTSQELDSLPGPTLVWGGTGSDGAGREDPRPEGTNHTNEIPSSSSSSSTSSSDDLLTPDPAVTTPAEGGLMATPLEAEEAEPGEANELVKEAAGPSEVGLLGAEAWKVGGIAAAVVVVLETLLIVVYILKCRTGAKSAPSLAACEEGLVEPETPTGGDCSDDSLPASNGDTQLRIAEPDPSDVTSALAQHKGTPRQDHQDMAMSDLPPGPASTRGSSQDLRTSVL